MKQACLINTVIVICLLPIQALVQGQEPKQAVVLPMHQAKVEPLIDTMNICTSALSKSDKLLVVGLRATNRHSIEYKVIDAVSGETIQTIEKQGHERGSRSKTKFNGIWTKFIRIRDDDQMFAATGPRKAVALWKRDEKGRFSIAHEFDFDRLNGHNFQFIGNDLLVYEGVGYETNLHLIDTESLKTKKKLKINQKWQWIQVTSDGKTVIAAEERDYVHVFDLDTGKVTASHEADFQQAHGLQLAPDGKHAAILGQFGVVLLNLESGESEELLSGNCSAQFSADSKLLYAYDGRGNLRVFDVATKRLLRCHYSSDFSENRLVSRQAHVSKDGKLAFVGGFSKEPHGTLDQLNLLSKWQLSDEPEKIAAELLDRPAATRPSLLVYDSNNVLWASTKNSKSITIVDAGKNVESIDLPGAVVSGFQQDAQSLTQKDKLLCHTKDGVAVFDLEAKELIQEFHLPEGFGYQWAHRFSSDETRLAVANSKQLLRFNLQDGSAEDPVSIESFKIHSPTIHPSLDIIGGRAHDLYRDGLVGIDVGSQEVVLKFSAKVERGGVPYKIQGEYQFDSWGRMRLAASNRVFHPTDTSRFKDPQLPARKCKYSRDSRYLVLQQQAGEVSRILLHDLRTEQSKLAIAIVGNLKDYAISNDNKTLVLSWSYSADFIYKGYFAEIKL